MDSKTFNYILHNVYHALTKLRDLDDVFDHSAKISTKRRCIVIDQKFMRQTKYVPFTINGVKIEIV